jgi:hypothetical protein
VTPVAGIRIAWSGGAITVELRDTPTVKALLAALPCQASASTWGEEVYFELPVKTVLEPDAQQVVDPGTVCFWVEGSALALPYGRTPVSKGNESRLVTRCNVVGNVVGEARQLRGIKDGAALRLEAIP